MVAFLKDPSGPALWEENPEAKDIVHVETEKVSFCLRASSAATQLSAGERGSGEDALKRPADGR